MGFSFRKQTSILYPKKVSRSSVRLFFGQIYFQTKRYFTWLVDRRHFSRKRLDQDHIKKYFPFVIFKHSSPIYRNLKDVPRYLQENKKVNLTLAIAKLNCLVLNSNEIFSFWYLVGKPTKKKGYLPGMQLRNGSFIERTGGGLCQLANLIYWMTLHSPLDVKERWRHSFDIFPDSDRTLPFGSGATLAYNYIDLQIKNTTKQRFVLHLWIQDEYLFGEWRTDLDIPYEYKVYESYHEFHAEPWGGYTRRNIIRREIKQKIDHALLKDELVTENIAWMMYEPLLEGNAKK